MRDLVFVSHANPEDNEFTRWLGAQLAREGYRVWSDITRLIGGEPFWARIEDAIRNHAAKFLFVLSRASNDPNRGTIDELHLARTVSKGGVPHDFVLPLRVDDLPFADRYVAIQQLNVVDFTRSWALGLACVLAKLKKDAVPVDTDRFNSSTVSSWWRAQYEGLDITRNEPEEYLSNWFPIRDLPIAMQVHTLATDQPSLRRFEDKLRFPCFPVGRHVISFASASDLGLRVTQTTTVVTADALKAGRPDLGISARTSCDALVYILRSAWQSFVETTGLPLHSMGKERRCAYFAGAEFRSRLLSFEIPGVLSGRRSLVGEHRGRVWHFGITADAQTDPILCYVIYPHVLFSDDGMKIWDSTSRLHSARRSACKQWWNQHWRDRLLTAMNWLAKKQGGSDVTIPLSSESSIRVPFSPVTYDSPIGYDDAAIIENPFAGEGDMGSEDDAEEGEA